MVFAVLKLHFYLKCIYNKTAPSKEAKCHVSTLFYPETRVFRIEQGDSVWIFYRVISDP